MAIPALSIVLLIPTVLVALRHADAAADRLGEPFGTLLLTLAVTTIEVSLICFVMLHGEKQSDPCTRVGVLGGHAGRQRRHRRLPDARRAAPRRAGTSAARHQCLPRRTDRAVRAAVDPAEFHHHDRAGHLLAGTAGLHQPAFAAALRRISLHPVDPPSCVLPRYGGRGGRVARRFAHHALLRDDPVHAGRPVRGRPPRRARRCRRRERPRCDARDPARRDHRRAAGDAAAVSGNAFGDPRRAREPLAAQHPTSCSARHWRRSG